MAIPTVATILQQQANVSWWKMPCVGDCCHQVATPSKYDPRVASALCGHKLALDKPQYRGLLQRTVHPNYTWATEFARGDAKRFVDELKESGAHYNNHYSLKRNATRAHRCTAEGLAERPGADGVRHDEDAIPSPAWVARRRRQRQSVHAL